jgi:hypothetical protein
LKEETFDPPGDINGAQVKPAGMHVIRFPFLDDLRSLPRPCLPLEASPVCLPSPQPVDVEGHC